MTKSNAAQMRGRIETIAAQGYDLLPPDWLDGPARARSLWHEERDDQEVLVGESRLYTAGPFTVTRNPAQEAGAWAVQMEGTLQRRYDGGPTFDKLPLAFPLGGGPKEKGEKAPAVFEKTDVGIQVVNLEVDPGSDDYRVFDGRLLDRIGVVAVVGEEITRYTEAPEGLTLAQLEGLEIEQRLCLGWLRAVFGSETTPTPPQAQ